MRRVWWERVVGVVQATVGHEVDELTALVDALSRFARQLDPDALLPAQATGLLPVAARGESILATIKALAMVRVDDTAAWKHAGFRSAADYAASKTGTTRSAAKSALDTARKARDLPDTDAAMRDGNLTAAQAREVADAATADPDAEADLLRSARDDAFASFRDKARRARAAADPDPEARTRRIHRERSLRHWTDPEGVFNAVLRTTPQAGARLLAGLEPHRRAVFNHARQQGRREPPEAYLADALDHLATTAAAPGTDHASAHSGSRTEGRGGTAGAARPGQSTGPEATARAKATPGPAGASSAQTATGRDDGPVRSRNHCRTDEPMSDPTTPHTGPDRPPHRPAPAPSSHDPASTLFDPPPDTPPDAPAPPTGSVATGRSEQNRSSPSPQPPPAAPAAPVVPVEPVRRSARTTPPTTVHLNIDLAALQRGRLRPGDTCEIPGVGPIDLTTARAMLGDATVELIVKHGTNIATVIHYGRTVTTAQRHALETRDPTCIVPGCGTTHNLEIDHRTGWAINHQTQLHDLARLCKHHHQLKTHHGYTYTGGPGTWTWHPPNPGKAQSDTDTDDTSPDPP